MSGSNCHPAVARQCPNCRSVRPARTLLSAGRLSSTWGSVGGCRRRCPVCGWCGRTEEFHRVAPPSRHARGQRSGGAQ
jgi:hypothetical protein